MRGHRLTAGPPPSSDAPMAPPPPARHEQVVHVKLDVVDALRVPLGPGDALVLRWCDRDEVSMDDAELVKSRVRAILGRPDLPVLVVGRMVDVGVVVLPHHEEEPGG